MSEVFGTIVAKPELPYARVLAKSLRRWHPDTPFLVLLADEVDDHFDPAAEPFGLLSLSQLPIPDSGRFCFLHERLPLRKASIGTGKDENGVGVVRELVLVVHQDEHAQHPGSHEPDCADHEEAAHADRLPPGSVVVG